MTPILYSDADNTLWDTDAVYRRAHVWLFNEAVERLAVKPEVDDPLAFVRSIDQDLIESHPAHFRYPPSLLVRELLNRLSREENDSSRESLVAEVTAGFTDLLSEPATLREGVLVGLKRLHLLRYPVHVITEGSLERCSRRVRDHGISAYVKSIESVTKDAQHFLKLRQQLSAERVGWVVGDQLTRDILPARASGLNTLYFPGSFLPRWERALSIDPEIIQIKSFADVPLILENTREIAKTADLRR